MILDGLGAELTFRDGIRRTTARRSSFETKAVLVPHDEWFELYPRPSPLRFDGVSRAWIQVRDGDGNPLTDELYVGRLDGTPCGIEPRFSCLVTAETYVTPVAVERRGELELILSGGLTFARGVSARVVLRKKESTLEPGRPPDADLDLDLDIVSPGQAIQFPAQPIADGEHCGMLDSLLFLDGCGQPIGDAHLLRPAALVH